jgi:hypothetical protein
MPCGGAISLAPGVSTNVNGYVAPGVQTNSTSILVKAMPGLLRNRCWHHSRQESGLQAMPGFW